MFEETTGSWSTVQVGGVFYRRGILTTSATLRKLTAGAFRVMLVGAGGSGSSVAEGGGGGAGWIREIDLTLAAGTYSIVIGAAPIGSAQKGGDTIAFGQTAPGGGAGASGDGGNGGGANGVGGSGNPVGGGTGNPGTNGGTGSRGGTAARAGGGGGGNGGAGLDGGNNIGGQGGPGRLIAFAGLDSILGPGGNGSGRGVNPSLPVGFDRWGAGGGANGQSAAQPGAVVVLYPLPVTEVAGPLVLLPVALTGSATLISPASGELTLPSVALTGSADLISPAIGALDLPPIALTGRIDKLYLARGRPATARQSRIWTRAPGSKENDVDHFLIKQGATAPALRREFVTVDGVMDLTGAVVTFSLSGYRGPVFSGRTCRIIDGAAVYYWQEDDTAEAGEYRGQFWITWPDGSTEGAPAPGVVEVRIERRV